MYAQSCLGPRWTAWPVTLFLLLLPPISSAETLTFNWPAPASARLVFEENTNHREVTTEMLLRVSPVEDGTKWRLDFTDVQITEINGHDVTVPEEQAYIPGKFKVMTEVVPSLVIDGEANIVAMPGVEEQVDAQIERTAEQAHDATAEDMRLALLDPAILDLLRAKVDGFWHLWIGLWMDKDLGPDARLDFDAESDYLGITVPSEGRFEVLEPPEEHPGATHLAFELVARGDALREAVSKSVATAFERAEQALPEELAAEALKSAERRQRVDAILDRVTMRPYRVRAVTSLTLDYEAHGAQAQIEEQVFRFDWQEQ